MTGYGHGYRRSKVYAGNWRLHIDCGDGDVHRSGMARGCTHGLDPAAAGMCDRPNWMVQALWAKSTAADNAPSSPLWIRGAVV